MSDDVTLEPCPFCGGDETSHGYSLAGGVEVGNCECHSCNACIWADTEAEAVAAWNTRHCTLHEEVMKAAEIVIDYVTSILWTGRPEAIAQRPAMVDEALRLFRARIDSLLADKEQTA